MRSITPTSEHLSYSCVKLCEVLIFAVHRLTGLVYYVTASIPERRSHGITRRKPKFASVAKHFVRANEVEAKHQATLNPSRDRCDQLHASAAVLSKKGPLHCGSDGLDTSSGWGVEGRNCRPDAKRPTAALHSHCTDYCHSLTCCRDNCTHKVRHNDKGNLHNNTLCG
jgi:hypothetical protein